MYRQKICAWVLSLSAVLAATSCHEDIGFESGSGVGRIAPQIELTKTVVSAKKAASRADGEGKEELDVPITSDSLTVTLTQQSSKAKSSNKNIYTYLLGELLEGEKTFPVGTYLVEALYGDPKAEGYDCGPSFYGSQEIVVAENETTEVKFDATLAQSMVTLVYTDQFKKYMSKWSAEINTPQSIQLFAETDTTAADATPLPVYVVPGDQTVYVSITKPNGQSAKLKVGEFNAAVQYHYTMTVDIEQGAGDANLVVTYDDALAEEKVVIDLSDELMSAPAPTITGVGVENGGFFNVKEGEAFNNNVKANILARGTLGEVWLTTVSDDLIAAGWPEKINLMAATAAQQETLKKLGLNCTGLWKNPDKMAVVDFSGVFANTKEAQFNLVATDTYGKTSEAFQFKYTLIESQIEITEVGSLLNDATTLDLKVSYPGSSEIGIKYLGGEWGATEPQTATIVSKTGANGVYDITIKVSEGDESLELFAVAGNKTSKHVTVTRKWESVVATVSDNDVFATKATIVGSVKLSSAVNPQVAYREKAATTRSENEWTIVGSAVNNVITANVTGLKPGTTYEYTGVNNGTPLTVDIRTFTTEAATQLPNSDMESWYRVAGKTNYWWIDYPGADASAVWGTMNLLTTSGGGSGTSWTDRSGCAYNASSGTRQSTDVHGGTYAALVKTVGWGTNNSAAVSSGFGTCKNVTPGELYLGKYDADSKKAVYSGYAFASRPSSLTFYYKYVKVGNTSNDDYAYVQVVVYDASGNVIASADSQISDMASSYTAKTLNLTYASGAAKAAKIMVRFKSSHDNVAANDTYMTPPPARNTSTGEYSGSELYIDDLTLNY
jgi:hypothetical protein